MYAEGFHGLYGGILLVIYRNADDYKALVAIFLVGGNHIGCFGPAGAAPRGPEINKSVFAGADEVFEGTFFPYHFTIGGKSNYLILRDFLQMLIISAYLGIFLNKLSAHLIKLHKLFFVSGSHKNGHSLNTYQIIRMCQIELAAPGGDYRFLIGDGCIHIGLEHPLLIFLQRL